MIIEPDEVVPLTVNALNMREAEQTRLRRISRYVQGKQDPPYTPKGVNAEYRWIARKARRNFLPLVVSVISQNLHVDGYRQSGDTVNEVMAPQRPQPGWDSFRANRMVSRQHGVHRSVIKLGSAYVVVLPGSMSTDEEQLSDVPVIRPVSPRYMTAFYADEIDDEWPQFAIQVRSVNLPGGKARVYVSVYDEATRYILSGTPGASVDQQKSFRLADPDDPLLDGQSPIASHDLGVCPVVRFLYESDLDGEADCQGEVEPLMPIQDQINFDTFNLMISTQFAAFRQRWVSGMAPVDEEGRAAAPFQPGVDRVWAAEDAGTKFGEFGETALAPYSGVREDGIRHMSTISQIPPYSLLGQVANLSAEALAAAKDGQDRHVDEIKANLTDPWRNVFRLESLARGDKEGWNDLFGTVIWRDTSARAFGATIDGLTKAAQMLGVPEEELWPLIPGVTQETVATWRLAKQRADAQQLVQQAVNAAQVPPPPGAQPPAGPPPGQSAPGGTPANPPRGPGGRPAEPA